MTNIKPRFVTLLYFNSIKVRLERTFTVAALRAIGISIP